MIKTYLREISTRTGNLLQIIDCEIEKDREYFEKKFETTVRYFELKEVSQTTGSGKE